MLRRLLATMLAVAGVACGPRWITWTSEAGGFYVDLPGTPVASRRSELRAGAVEADADVVGVTPRPLLGEPVVAYVVVVIRPKVGSELGQTDLEALVAAHFRNVFGTEGVQVAACSPDRDTCSELTLSRSGPRGAVARIVLTRRGSFGYALGVVGPGEQTRSKEAERFFGSLSFRDEMSPRAEAGASRRQAKHRRPTAHGSRAQRLSGVFEMVGVQWKLEARK